MYLEVDDSKVGLSAAILQSQTDQIPNNVDNDFIPTDLQPVAYASKSFTTTEQNYVNIERQLLAALHGLEKFHHFTYAGHVRVITYHKPSLSIVKKDIINASPKIGKFDFLECTDLI